MNLERLEKLAHIPRAVDDQNLDKIRERPMFFMRDAVRRWEEEMRTAPLVFAYVVQAEPALFKRGKAFSGRSVLLYSTDPGYTRNGPWLSELAERLLLLRTQRIRDPEALQIGMMLVDEQSEFSLAVPLSLTRLVLARLVTHSLSRASLPQQCIPESRLIPALALPKRLLPLPAEMWE